MAVATQSVNALEVTSATVAGRLTDVTVKLAPGVLAGLIGPNGSGKSTLLQVAGGLLPTDGSVRWNGRELKEISFLERGRTASWVPQEARFEFGFSVRDVVAQGRFAHGDDDHGVDDVLAKLDLTPLANRAVNQLSGGERQRVLLARALATDAAIQLWDEPLAQLDPKHVLDVLNIARDVTRKGAAMLMSLHDLRVAHCLDIVVVLQRGTLRAAGKPEEVLTPELLLEVFGVRARTAPSLILELP
jgi:iron complex transport system ATP-binding protein